MQKMKEKILLSFINKYLLILFICCAFISSAMAKEPKMPSADHILNQIEKRYFKKGFTADFFQISKLKALDINETALGKAVFCYPGKMVWEYLEPQQHKMITNGKMLWVYRPDQNQVMLGHAENFFKKGLGGAFLSDISKVRKNYIISLKDQDKTVYKLLLIPKIKTPEIQSILIVVLKKNYNIKKIITQNIYEDTIEFEFRNLKFKTIDDSLFEFKIPENASIIQLDNKPSSKMY